MFKKPDILRKTENEQPKDLNPESKCVLAVDDDSIVLNMTRRMLKAMGYTVDTAPNAAEAMRYLRCRQYDLVVTDMEMPEMDGFSLACWIKNRSEKIKVVIMTGLPQVEVKAEMNTNMVDGWIFKPFSVTDLRTVMEAA